MIGKVIKGWDGERLIRYLFSQGKYNEHTEPTVVAAWQGDPGALQPVWVGPGDCDFAPGEIGKLARHVAAAAIAAGLPTVQPEPGTPGYTKHGYVWHLPVAIGADDGRLDMKTWRRIAEDMLAETGIAKPGDAGACRWIAVHHGTSVGGNDHIHIAAVLVRQDTGKRFFPSNDYTAVRRVARRWEKALGLRFTADPDAFVQAPTPTRGEQEKAKRRAEGGDEGMLRAEPGAAARLQLRQVILEQAAVADGVEDFLGRLGKNGVLVDLKYDQDGRVRGWSVAADGDTTRSGDPIWFAPSRHLGADTSWPRVTGRWTAQASRPHAPSATRQPHEVLADAAGHVRTATTTVKQRRADTVPVAREFQELLVSWAAVAEGAARRGPLSRAAWSSDSATRTRYGLPPVPAVGAAAALRSAARELAEIRLLSGRGRQRDASADLAVAVAELLLELAAWHQEHGRVTAARHAELAAAHVRTHGAEVAPRGVPTVAGPSADGGGRSVAATPTPVQNGPARRDVPSRPSPHQLPPEPQRKDRR
ncbi:relaxase/mobilization nuclease domain-containing protein [Nocardia thailandica]